MGKAWEPGCPRALAARASGVRQPRQRQRVGRESASKTKGTIHVSRSQKWSPLTCATFCCSEPVTRSGARLRRGGGTGMRVPGTGVTRHPTSCLLNAEGWHRGLE